MTQPLRFVTFLAPNMKPVYQYIAETIAQKLDCPTVLTDGISFDEFALDQADVGFICGLPYVNLVDQSPTPVELIAAPVLQGDRYQDRPIYFSDVIVHRDSPYQTFDDLCGRSWAFNDPDSQSGCGVVRYWLAQTEVPAGYFGQVIQSGFHQKSIRMVCAGEIDASAIDSQVLAIELRDHPELADQLRVVAVMGPSPIQPVVAATRLSPTLKDDLREAFLTLHLEPGAQAMLDRGLIRRFAAVEDSDYDDIRRMVEISRDVRFP